jgi:hypothetical protein
MLVVGWKAVTSLVRGEERVSSGILEASDGSTMKQSSMSGSVRPSVNSLCAVIPGYEVRPPVGIPPSSTGR